MAFSIWWLIPAFVGLIGILMVVGGVGRVFKARFASGIFRVLFGGLTLAGAAIIGLVGLNLQTYAQLTKERLAGTVTLKKLDEFKYTATVDLADNGKLRGAPTDYEVTGEDFRVEGPILKFKGWANVIGADSIYRIDHIEGVYVDSDCENRFDPKRQDFVEKGSPNDAFRTIRSLGESWKLVNAVDVLNIDARRMPMADGAVYNIKATQQGLELEPGNQIATEQQNSLLSRAGVQCETDPNAAPVATPANPTGAAQVQTTVEPPAQTNAPPAQTTAPATPPSN